ncbi:MAG: indolepyruvate ferredoxin oxidoreductase family protein, partial [Rhodospirillales bacterium]|nr:indolepyruvate ferredoxin oxidoreductase family protein [Rhodospirillales bacterium]
GYVTGYRGSPLGTVDMEFGRARATVDAHHIKFQAAVNEDLGAAAVWGTQQANLFPGATHDGVFAMWYGKGPGVDRSGDAFRHANLAGSSPLGGVLVLAGDDPSGKSSTVPSQSEHALMDAWIPILAPCNVQELLDYGLMGWAMSRFSGCWVAMKTLSDTMDSSAVIDADLDRVQIALPEGITMPTGGVHARWPDPKDKVEGRLQEFKMPAVAAFARANNLDKTIIHAPVATIGIMAAGKAWLDTLQALEDLGIDDAKARALGIRVRKVGMPWPLEPEGTSEFAQGLKEIIVIDEKRPVIEPQLKEQLYHQPDSVRARITGKHDPDGAPAIPAWAELNADSIARVIAGRLTAHGISANLFERLEQIEDRATRVSTLSSDVKRLPYYCSGCPHNTSTVVPEGSQAAAGIGCHFMVTWMDRDTDTFTQMGAEGANWLGRAPFTKTPHMFVNIGDGTLFHSGTLAIRAGVASGANVTYKILYNDAVAMTGGQPMDGPMTVPMVTQQMRAEGIERIAIVSDEPDKYPVGTIFAPGTSFHHRDDFDQVQRDIRHWPGVSVLIYDQTCAAEKRRRRKRGTYPDPDKRAFINSLVCEGCGDCGIVSNCVAIVPKHTAFGRKRAIDQASCNKDYSCVDGFCPSFVTVEGATLRKPDPIAPDQQEALPEPPLPELEKPYTVMMSGIGGTGVVTVGHLLAMAAHLDGRGVSVLDVAGLAQKNGAVFTHLSIARSPDQLRATRIGPGQADLLLGFDMVASASADTLSCLGPSVSNAVVNTHQTMTADFTQNPDLTFPVAQLMDAIQGCVKPEGCHSFDAHAVAAGVMGDTIAANITLMGYAWQQGLIPISLDAVMEAIRLNGVAVEFNQIAFTWGRRMAHNPAQIQDLATNDTPVPESTADLIETLTADLVAYQNQPYADQYRQFIAHVQHDSRDELTRAVAINLHKLMAYKDEYEVARLFTDGRFEAELADQFEGNYRITYHMAPPVLARKDLRTSVPAKMAFGGWMKLLLGVIAGLRGLRGTPFDVFGYSKERRAERSRIADYKDQIATLIEGLDAANDDTVVQIASLPERIRGFGHIKEHNARHADSCADDLLAR